MCEGFARLRFLCRFSSPLRIQSPLRHSSFLPPPRYEEVVKAAGLPIGAGLCVFFFFPGPFLFFFSLSPPKKSPSPQTRDPFFGLFLALPFIDSAHSMLETQLARSYGRSFCQFAFSSPSTQSFSPDAAGSSLPLFVVPA